MWGKRRSQAFVIDSATIAQAESTIVVATKDGGKP
jgi:hypothetical protein